MSYPIQPTVRCRRRWLWIATPLMLALGAFLFLRYGRSIWVPVVQRVTGRQTVEDVIRRIGSRARGRWAPSFQSAGWTEPPERLALLGFKHERRLEVWGSRDGGWRWIRTFPILGASGGPGPKLREGDRQVPEGIYRVVALNPNSSYHLSMKLDYPNRWDVRHAQAEGRTEPGSNIFIHGKTNSIGCLAMGDESIEDLFWLVHETGLTHVEVLLCPNDLRVRGPVTDLTAAPAWVPALYHRLEETIGPFRSKRD